jgi:hypothetical protein
MIFDEVCETLDELQVPGDTPFRVFFDGQELELLSIDAHQEDGTVRIELQEA